MTNNINDDLFLFSCICINNSYKNWTINISAWINYNFTSIWINYSWNILSIFISTNNILIVSFFNNYASTLILINWINRFLVGIINLVNKTRCRCRWSWWCWCCSANCLVLCCKCFCYYIACCWYLFVPFVKFLCCVFVSCACWNLSCYFCISPWSVF